VENGPITGERERVETPCARFGEGTSMESKAVRKERGHQRHLPKQRRMPA